LASRNAEHQPPSLISAFCPRDMPSRTPLSLSVAERRPPCPSCPGGRVLLVSNGFFVKGVDSPVKKCHFARCSHRRIFEAEAFLPSPPAGLFNRGYILLPSCSDDASRSGEKLFFVLGWCIFFFFSRLLCEIRSGFRFFFHTDVIGIPYLYMRTLAPK